MKLGIFSWFGFVMPFRERLELIKKAGFDSISIWWEDEECPKTSKAEMLEIAWDLGLEIDNIHAPFCNSNCLWSDSSFLREEVIKRHIAWLEDCAKYNIPMMVMHLTDGDETPEPNKYGIESMNILTRKAEVLGVKIAVENTRRKDDVAWVLSQIPSENLGFCYDTSHANFHKGIETILLKEFGDRLFTTHISDNDGKEDRHWIPGNGSIDWGNLGKLFPIESYRGALMLEVCPKEEKDPESFLEKAWNRASWIREVFLSLNPRE